MQHRPGVVTRPNGVGMGIAVETKRVRELLPLLLLHQPNFCSSIPHHHGDYLLQVFKGDSSGSQSRHLVRDSLCRRGLFKVCYHLPDTTNTQIYIYIYIYTRFCARACLACVLVCSSKRLRDKRRKEDFPEKFLSPLSIRLVVSFEFARRNLFSVDRKFIFLFIYLFFFASSVAQ